MGWRLKNNRVEEEEYDYPSETSQPIQPYNTILTTYLPLTDYQVALLDVMDLARTGDYRSLRLLERFFYNLDKILGPFDADVFVAADLFVASIDA